MKRIGIIGGGQLGMYLALSAYQMGFETIVYDNNKNCSAKDIATKFYFGSFDDKNKLEEFAKECDVITYEFENINNEIVKDLASRYNVVQKNHPLLISSSRYNERIMADELKIKQPSWQLVNNKEDIKDIKLEYPYLLKSISLGYDGKNQYIINNKDDLNKVDYSLSYLAESKINFDYEISLIAIRSINDELLIYDPFYNIHHHGILNITLINYEVDDIIIKQAKAAITKIMLEKDIFGILTCEFFVKNNHVYFNEMAPRPHNSGHITMDTHYISQYENHIRAITGMPLGNTKIKSDGFMVNVLGQDVEKVNKFMSENANYAKYYDYHKEARLNRKIGHLIVFEDKFLENFIKNWRETNE